MNVIPSVIVERIAIYADTNSLVALAACCRQLWWHITQLQPIWMHRYQEHYKFKDDKEAAWISWYTKTLRISSSSASSASSASLRLAYRSVENKHYNINWFHALCHRRTTDANWFRNQSKHLQSIITTREHTRVVVLQRILIKDTILHKCRVIEQCQPLEGTNDARFWRLCTPCYTGFDPDITVKNISISDKYLLMFISHPEGSSSDYQLPGSILVWPVNRIATMPPRCLTYPYNGSVNIQRRCRGLVVRRPSSDRRGPGRLNQRPTSPIDFQEIGYAMSSLVDMPSSVNIRGCWAMFNYSVKKPDSRKVEAVIIHVLNLNTGRVCINTFNSVVTWSFIQRITNDTVTVIRVSFEGFHFATPVKWSVWEFSNILVSDTPRCLMKGSFVVSGFNDLTPLMERLDDDRIIVRCLAFRNNNNDNGDDDGGQSINDDMSNNNTNNNTNTLTLAVISTRSSSSNTNKVLHDQQPVWSRNILMKSAKPLISLNRVIVVTRDGCTVYDLDNGDALAFTPMNTIQSLLHEHCLANAHYHLRMTASYIQGYVLCESIDNTSYVAVDPIHTERSGKLRLAYVFEHYNIKASQSMLIENLWDKQYYAKLLRIPSPNGKKLELRISTVCVLVIECNGQYKVLDFSFP
ncbi:hypothetical protein BDF22DRAFT_773405 [Syncephalis plumigaleata]|nr:hypothetical protein BDF22DRAFT_773405 [Syncephalis plumigaleata]